jgi:hypothetical protein
MSALTPEIQTEDQRRVAKRQRVLKSAKIVLDNWRALDCQLRDVSATGARIKIANTTEVPDLFRLYTATDNMIRDVKLAWRRHNEVGVIFDSEPKTCALRKF